MNNPMQQRNRLPGICGRVAGTALALAIMLVPAVLATGSAQAQTYIYSVLYSFTGAPDGANPHAGLAQDPQGNLYGTTFGGGDIACRAGGCGTVFKVDTTGTESVLHSFTGTAGDGGLPEAGLVQDVQGNLYGTTFYGGDRTGCNAPNGCGTVFKLDTTNKETVLYSFAGPPDGALAEGLMWGSNGNLYGTTYEGGTGDNNGTVFKLDTTYKETVFYSFTGFPDGERPSSLVKGAQGNLYGTTGFGGNLACKGGCGTVFKLDMTGTETVLYRFTGGADGADPGGLVRDAQGNLYGTTEGGGISSCTGGCGVVFKLDTTGNESVLYSFTGTEGDGATPVAGLVRDAHGNLYGTTFAGGNLECTDDSNYPGCGTVFKVDTTGKETVLYAFPGGADGATPLAGLVLDAQGNLYGTTVGGGASNYGTVFELTPVPATMTTLSSSPNPSSYGQAVTFIAVVTSKLGAPPDGESVTFMKGTTVLGTGTLSGGSASFTTSTLKVGTNSITAVYAGDSNFAASTSKAVKQVVSKATTTTALASSLNPSKVGQSVTFTASVAPQFSGTVTGNVTFYDGTTLLKSVALSGGSAKFTTVKLTSGVHSIKATYNGSTSFTGSSASLTQTVN